MDFFKKTIPCHHGYDLESFIYTANPDRGRFGPQKHQWKVYLNAIHDLNPTRRTQLLRLDPIYSFFDLSYEMRGDRQHLEELAMTQAANQKTICWQCHPALKHKLQQGQENKVTFATGTLIDDALSWWNAYAQPMGVDQANQITWTELKRLLTNKYCPRTEVRKMEYELYNLTVKGNDLKPYTRRFQELAALCPNMVPNTEKLLEAFIGGLLGSIEGNVTSSKPQTLKEAINIA
ncbi:reverse transcriptase domain-containing protein [Tanacetum coccineum]